MSGCLLWENRAMQTTFGSKRGNFTTFSRMQSVNVRLDGTGIPKNFRQSAVFL